MIDIDTAMAQAQTLLATIQREVGVDCAIVLTKVHEDEDGWYFPYQSKEFLASGDFSKSLVGNWPIFVNRDGSFVGPKRPSTLRKI